MVLSVELLRKLRLEKLLITFARGVEGVLEEEADVDDPLAHEVVADGALCAGVASAVDAVIAAGALLALKLFLILRLAATFRRALVARAGRGSLA